MAGPVEQEIHDLLVDAFSPAQLQVINESSGHNVPPGSETHFKVVIVSTTFEGDGLVQKHRKVHAALQKPLDGGVHALSIVAHTPAQWTEKGGVIPESPPCRGGAGR